MQRKTWFMMPMLAIVLTVLVMPSAAFADESSSAADAHPMYRLYNPNSGEHFYTADAAERDNVVKAGWSYEGVAWNAPATSSTPVYRLYNANAGDHHYTTDRQEYDSLVAAGWVGENVGWYSDDAKGVGMYRLYNPNAYALGMSGAHHYTASKEEADNLVAISWILERDGAIEGAWYGVAEQASDESFTNPTSIDMPYKKGEKKDAALSGTLRYVPDDGLWSVCGFYYLDVENPIMVSYESFSDSKRVTKEFERFQVAENYNININGPKQGAGNVMLDPHIDKRVVIYGQLVDDSAGTLHYTTGVSFWRVDNVVEL